MPSEKLTTVNDVIQYLEDFCTIVSYFQDHWEKSDVTSSEHELWEVERQNQVSMMRFVLDHLRKAETQRATVEPLASENSREQPTLLMDHSWIVGTMVDISEVCAKGGLRSAYYRSITNAATTLMDLLNNREAQKEVAKSA